MLAVELDDLAEAIILLRSRLPVAPRDRPWWGGARWPYLRFRWLAAPRSTVVHPGPIHGGLTNSPAADLDHLIDAFVR